MNSLETCRRTYVRTEEGPHASDHNLHEVWCIHVVDTGLPVRVCMKSMYLRCEDSSNANGQIHPATYYDPFATPEPPHQLGLQSGPTHSRRSGIPQSQG